jgi:hypothetical protein
VKFLGIFVSVFIALTWVSVVCADLADGLVLYMPLDEGAGNNTADNSPNGFTGELRGNPEWVDGKFGKALRFAASSDFVFIADDPAFHISGEITQAAWINLDRLPGAHAVIFGTRNAAGGRNIGFGFGMNGSNNIKVWTNDPAGNFLDINDTTTILETGQWYYLAYTHQTDNSGLVEIYVDGEMTHSQASNNPVDPAGVPNEVTIGTWTTEAWTGIVDEPRLWNRVLSAAEIRDSMNRGASDLVAVMPGEKLATSWGEVKSAF